MQIPGSGRFPWRGKWQPTPVFLHWKCHGQKSLVGYSPWGRKESDTSEHTYTQTYSHTSGSKEFKHMLFKGQLYTESEKHTLIRRWTLNNKNLGSNASQIGYVTTVNAHPSQNLSNLNLNFIQNFPLWIWGKNNNLESQWKAIFEMSRDKSVLPVSFYRFEGLGSVSA